MLCLFFAVSVPAQHTASPDHLPVSGGATAALVPSRSTAGLTPGGVPRLVPFSGVLRDTAAAGSEAAITFSLFEFQEGGAPLWSETQSVRMDARGRYTVLLGATQPDGVPLDLFTSGKAVWLGAQAAGGGEPARVLLVAVPYALKAADADTLGGKPASAFLTTGATPAISASGSAPLPNAAAAKAEAGPDTACSSITSGGGAPFLLALFASPCDIEPSNINVIGSRVGIGTTPQTTLDVGGSATIRGFLQLPATGAATPTAGFPSQPLDSIASAFNSSTALVVNQRFRWQAEPAGNNTSAPSGHLNLLFASGTGTPVETGFSVASNGLITFASGQTYPGIPGGITGVTAGVDLLGGGNTGNVTLSLDTKKVPQLASANRFTTSQSVTGNLSVTGQLVSTVATGTAPLSVSSATQVPNLNATFLGGFLGTSYARTGAANTFSGSQTIAATADKAMGLTVTSTSGDGLQITAGTDSASNGRTGLTATGGVSKLVSAPGGTGIVAAGGGVTRIGQTNGDGLHVSGGSSIFGTNGGVGIMAFGGNAHEKDGVGGAAGDAIQAIAGTIATGTGRSALFQGDVDVVGTLTASTKDFRIDHPLDAANKYLYHASVESSEMLNIYTGNSALDAAGQALVQLPDWFQAENADFRYQLTAMGASAPGLYIAQEMANNEFRIAGGKPGMKVSWLVAGVRQDAYAKAHPLVVEQDKPAKLRGYYLNPEVFGQPEDRALEIARNPEIHRQIKEMQSAGQNGAAPAQQGPVGGASSGLK